MHYPFDCDANQFKQKTRRGASKVVSSQRKINSTTERQTGYVRREAVERCDMPSLHLSWPCTLAGRLMKLNLLRPQLWHTKPIPNPARSDRL